MIIESRRLDRAFKVLEYVKLGLSNIEGDLHLGTYQNGREEGLSLRSCSSITTNGYVSWSEDRRSDQIVVYNSDIDPCQSITDEMYKNARYFDNEILASNFIVEFIKEGL